MSNTAQQVYNALNGYVKPENGGTIDLWDAATNTATSSLLGDMVSMLGLFGIDSEYLLQSVNLSLSPDEKTTTLVGTGTFNDPGNTNPTGKYNIRGTLVYTQNDGVFTLSLAISGDWKFDTFFAELPKTLMQRPSEGQGIRWYDSILPAFTVRSGIFIGKSGAEQDLRMTGSLLAPSDQYILDKTPMIGPYPLRLNGTVGLTTSERDYPILDLDAMGNPTSIEAAQEDGMKGQGPSPFSLTNPGITIISAKQDPPQMGIASFSTLELFGDFSLNGIDGRISTIILSTGNTWNFTVRFNENATFVQGLAQLTSLFGVVLPIPMDFPILSDFYLAQLDIDLEVTGTNNLIPSFTLSSFGITIRSKKPWVPPVPFITISDVGTRWVWSWTTVTNSVGGSEKTYSMSGSVFGTFNFGSGGAAPLPVDVDGPDDTGGGGVVRMSDPVAIRTSMSLPNFLIKAYMKEGDYIPLSDLFTYYFGGDGPSTGDRQMNVTSLRLNADPLGQNYYADATIFFGDIKSPDKNQGWDIDLGITHILMEQLQFYIQVISGNVGGGISGVFYLEQDDPADYTLPRFDLSADYPVQNPSAPEGWTIAGSLYPGTSIDLYKIVNKFIYGQAVDSTPPVDWIPQVVIDRLYASFTTGVSGSTNPSYKFGGTITTRWTPTIFNQQLKITASASIDVEKPASADKASGKIQGTFSVNKLALEAGMTFGVPEPTYRFKIQFDEIWLQATTSWRGKEDNRHQVVSVQLGGLTLGDMLEYLVNLAAPTLGFRLDSPWDVLKQIDLSQFVLTVDPTDNIVEFVFNTKVDLVIAELTSVGVRYSKESGENKVNMILTGSFLGDQYTSDDPLAWDVINDPPPEVPGAGKSLLDLRFIGVGQRVSFRGATPNTVAESVAELRRDMKEPPANGDPMSAGGLQFSSESQWLIGLDVKVMDTLDLAFIFNDPVLYGLSIGLGGEKAGSLAGLKFEILYKKITDDIGMYRIEFQVPDVFRTIQLGVVSITLGIVVVEIYTNGNFKVDLGFPYDRNFDRSFSLQAYVFIGRGGFYLGILNGDTSTQVPKISNGNFSPVIELGVGIAAGVGREIREGILSGGAYIQLEVIFQGVMAWFNPTSNGAASATYFKCQGVVALHGKIYGSIDFVVVKASVSLEAYAQASLTYESYQPMLIELIAAVEAKASVKILFVKVHFSFSMELEFSFTVGSAKPTPWIIDHSSSEGGDTQVRLAAAGSSRRSAFVLLPRKHRRLIALKQAHYHQLGLQRKAFARGMVLTSEQVGDTSYTLQWNPSAKVFSDSPRNAHMTLLPVFTIGDVPVNWSATVPDNDTPTYRTAFVLFADTGMSTTAQTASECALRSSAHSAMGGNEDTSTLAADILTEGLLRYAINALNIPASQGNTITSGQLEFMLEELDMPETMETGLSMEHLSTFFQTNINLWISGDPDSEPDLKSAMVMPIPPFMSWTSEQVGDVDFNTKNKIGSLYEWGISQLLSGYLPVSSDSEKPTDDNPANYESFASFMFRDFCLMLMENGFKEMQKHLQASSVTVAKEGDSTQSLSTLAMSLPQATVNYTIRSGDTVESVAEALGATVDELIFLNDNLVNELKTDAVGTVLQITLGVPPQVLASDNAKKSFAIQQCSLGTVVHQASTTDTLDSIAALFQTQTEKLLEYSNSAYPILSTANGILQTHTKFTMPAQTYSSPSDFTNLRTAAAFFVRYSDVTAFSSSLVPDMANWYAQVIAEVNDDLLNQLFPNQTMLSSVELPPGQELSVPKAFQNAYTDEANRETYTTIPGDTLSRIGFTLSLEQNYTDKNPNGVDQWQGFLSNVTSSGTHTWSIPEQSDISVRSGETIVMLVRRMIMNATWASPNTWTYNWNAIANWLGAASILNPTASVTVPKASTAQHNPLSFDVIEQVYGLSVNDAATALKDTKGLYAENTVLIVKLLPAQDIEVLIHDLLTGDSFASIVNQSSQMLMSGLQLPGLKTEGGHTVPDESKRYPLYDMTGQQVTVPVDNKQPTDVALAVDLTSQQSWIVLFDSITVVAGDTLASLEATYPDLLTYNPGLTEATLKIGMVLLTGPVTSSLNYSYTHQQVLEKSPATGLSVLPIPATPEAPAAMPLSGTVPKTYGLEHRIVLQSPVSLPIPDIDGGENVSGNPSLWMFPLDFQLQAIKGVTTPYELLYTQTGQRAGHAATIIQNSTFGLSVPFNLKQINAGTREFELIGVDTVYRQLLLDLRKWLQSQPAGDTTQAFLMLSPAPDANNTSGLTVLTNEVSETYLIKSNLSTEALPPTTDSYRVRGTEEDQELYTATMASLADFVTLLWEGSTVGGSGYFFGAGIQIPPSAIDNQGNITLQLLVIPSTQQATAPQGRTLLPFNNCALIGAGLDTTGRTVFIESADGSETLTQALVPAGSVGFTFTTDNPETATGYTDQEIQLKNLYGMMSYSVAQVTGSYFVAEESWTPVLPKPTDNSSLTTWEKEKARRIQRLSVPPETSFELEGDDEPYWYYEQVLPVNNFVTASYEEAAPEVTGLPDPVKDPYRGYGTLTAMPSANFVFGFRDVLGNSSGANSEGQGEKTIQVGYTDHLIGLAEWPSLASYFEVKTAESGTSADLHAKITYRSAELIPSPSENGDSHKGVILQQMDKYAAIYYQLIQKNIKAFLVSSLKIVDDPNYGNKGIELDDLRPLWSFAGGAYATAETLSKLTSAVPDGVTTLSAAVAKYGIRYVELAEANASFLVSDLFGANIPDVPAYFPFIENRSIDYIFTKPNIIPAGWPKPNSAEDVLKFSQNQALLLRTGTALSIPEKTQSTGVDQKLSDIANAANTSVELIATGTNAGQRWLANGFEFSMELDDATEMVVTVTDDVNSLDLVKAKYADEGVQVTVEMLAVSNQGTPGMFQDNKDLAVTHYVVKEGDTLETNSSGVSADVLAHNNYSTINIFDPGALVFFGNFDNVDLGSNDTTLQDFADRYACSMELLLSSNPNQPVGSFILPGSLQWPETINTLRTPYTILSTDKWNDIAGKFSSAEGTGNPNVLLANANQNVAQVFLQNTTLNITVSGTSYPVDTGAEASFSAVLLTLQTQVASATMTDVVNSIGDTADILSAGTLLMCPPVQLQIDTKPEDLPTTYGVRASEFGGLNAAMPGLIAKSQTLKLQGTNASVETIENDTLNAIVARFAAQGVSTSASEILDDPNNQTLAFLKSGGIALLPPNYMDLSVDIGSGGPYAGPITPLTVSIRFTRPEGLIDPSFKTATGTGAVEMIESAISAPTKGANNQELNYNDFVKELKQALPNIRLGTGQVEGVAQDLWIVGFDNSGIAQVDLAGALNYNGQQQPRTFALTPLYSHLVTRPDVSIQLLKSDGTLGDAKSIAFQSVDVELWARNFLEDVDRFLSGEYVSALYASAEMRPSLTGVLGSKATLRPKIANGMEQVLNVSASNDGEALESAQNALKQQLGISLARAYESTVMVQYNATVDSAWQITGSTLAPAALYGSADMPINQVSGVSIVAAKTHLEDAQSFVNFLMTLENVSGHRNIEGDINYDYTHIEFNESTTNVPDGYTASDWLTFVPVQTATEKPSALSGTDPGKALIPIPLRIFPGLPIVEGQSAVQSYPDQNNRTTSELSLWNYGFSYSHEHAEQDYVKLIVEFNLSQPHMDAMIEVDKVDLFTELAQYSSVSDELWQSLNGLVDPESTVPSDTVKNAVITFADLANRVASNWEKRITTQEQQASSGDDLVAGRSYPFESRVTDDPVTQEMVSYTLTALPPEHGEVSPGPMGNWPEAYVQVVNAKTGLLHFIQLDKGTPVNDKLVYTVPDGETVPSGSWPVFKLVWEDLNLSIVQNARSQVWVERNEDLLERNGEAEDIPVNSKFIFSTDVVVAPSVVTPLNTFSERININDLGSTLTDALNAMFTNLFGDHMDGQKVTMELLYGYELVSPDSSGKGGLVTYLPIGLYPNQTLGPGTAATISGMFEQWKSDNNPQTTGGEWVFSLKLYSQLTQLPQILLNVEYVVYRTT
ncbi:MAG: LysM peptidoglycan-binding domain-containing protein [Bacteroidetes bacterium]|nr:MAG: LysM peptidoglycan-binding domain-containing protein [Bacteroidota bacterium]